MTTAHRRRDLVVIGAGGLGREVMWLAQDSGSWNVIGVLDDADTVQSTTVEGAPVLGRIGDWPRFGNAEFVVAIGAPRTRRDIVARMDALGGPRYATMVHPSVRMSQTVTIGAGSVIAAGCLLTVKIEIGRHCILDRSANVGHDGKLGDFCTISPLVPIGGNVVLGPGTWVGAGASVRQGVRMAAGSMAGMGAVVVKDVAANQLVIGSPARPLKELPAWT
jgi:sugar O-acyltransferase (sialic acid O-acetyltransferase NeuD family)